MSLPGLRMLIWRVAGMVALSVSFGGGVLWTFFHRIIIPLRQMSIEVRSLGSYQAVDSTLNDRDEMRELGRYLRNLMEDVTMTRIDLQQSRKELAQAERLAAVGKLAATVAHEIRNPLAELALDSIGRHKVIKRYSRETNDEHRGAEALHHRMHVLLACQQLLGQRRFLRPDRVS